MSKRRQMRWQFKPWRVNYLEPVVWWPSRDLDRAFMAEAKPEKLVESLFKPEDPEPKP